MIARLVTEFFGTFFFLGTIALLGASGHILAPLGIGIALMAAVYFGGPVSGAHYNPAVTIAVWLQKKIAARDAAAYILVQLVAAFAAFALGWWLTGKADGIQPSLGFTAAQALVVEVFFTCLLALVVLNVACTDSCKGNSYFGLAIGGTIVAGAAAGSWISGGAYNPAVGFGATATGAAFGAGTWDSLWIYLVGPILGGALGSMIYGIQHANDSPPA